MAIALPPVVLDNSPPGNILLPAVLVGEYALGGMVLPSPLLGEYAIGGIVLSIPYLTEALPTTLSVTPDGGVNVGGAADVALDPYVHIATGGAALYGTADVTYNQITISVVTAQGGAQVSGTAIVDVSWLEQQASGGCKLSGTAVVFTQADYTVASLAAATSLAESITTFTDVAASAASAVSGAEAGFVFEVVGVSTVSAVSAAFSPNIFFEAVNSVVAALGGADAYRLIEGVVASSAQVTGGAGSTAAYFVTAESFAEIISSLQFVADFHDGWAYNLNTGAPSLYEGFKFNSFAKVGEEYFGCNDAGIFKLSGGTDNGVPIKATITTGMTGDKGIYRVDAVYAGARSEAPMNLTCRVEGVEYTYTFRSAADAMEPTRVTPGKGLRGRYWQFEITNQDGADMEIDTLEAVAAPASRRV